MIAGTGRCEIGSGAGVQHADLVQPLQRGRDVAGAIVDVVGDADGVDAAMPQRLPTDLGIGEESFRGVRPRLRQMQAAFQIAEHGIRRVQGIGDTAERHRGIGDVHQIDVAGQDQLAHHSSAFCCGQFSQSSPPNTTPVRRLRIVTPACSA
jgi:hypothetical protein